MSEVYRVRIVVLKIKGTDDMNVYDDDLSDQELADRRELAREAARGHISPIEMIIGGTRERTGAISWYVRRESGEYDWCDDDYVRREAQDILIDFLMENIQLLPMKPAKK